MTNTTNTNPRAAVAATIADAAANYAATVAAGPDTVGAVLTHAGNYIIPAATDGMATCMDDFHVGERRIPITKYPTKPAALDGTVSRDMRRCRACRDARTVANRAGRTVPVAPTATRPGNVPASIPAGTDPRDVRMIDRWGTTPAAAAARMVNVGLSTAATMDAIPAGSVVMDGFVPAASAAA